MNPKRILAFSSLVMVTLLSISLVFIVSSAQFIDDTESEFNAGSYSDTQFDAGNAWVEFDGTGLTNGSGDFTSQIFDATAESSWDDISWVPQKPTGKPLPNSDGIETVYNEGNIDMTGTVLLYHLDETSGSVADTSGSAFTGTVDGATLGATGIIGNAIDVTGNGDAVENNSISMTLVDDITMMAWFKYSGPGVGSPRILEISPTGNADSTALAPDGDGSLRAWAECNNGTRVGSVDDPTPTYDDGDWHHMAYTYDGTTGRLYVDGVQTDTGGGSCTNLADGGVLILGAISPESGQFTQTQHEFDGYIDEAVIMDTVLTAAEIEDVYERGAIDLRFQVRSCDDAACSGETFIGPDGTASTYYQWSNTTAIGTPTFTLTNVDDNQYFQYKTFFDSIDSSLSPELKSVRVDYTILNSPPDTPVNGAPASGATNQVANPSLSASAYNDDDLDAHTDTQWQVDDDSDFSSPVWTRSSGSAEEATTLDDVTGTFGNELTGATELLGGATYYWRVRYQDSFGNWSSYSASTTFTTKVPSGGGSSQAPGLFPPTNLQLLVDGDNLCTPDSEVSIYVSALNATEVHISNEPFFVEGQSISLSGSLTMDWTLDRGEGMRTVYAVFKSSAGVPSLTVSASIEVDPVCNDIVPSEEELQQIIEEAPDPTTVDIAPPPELIQEPQCDIGCENNEYVLYIINPDGTRRDSRGNFAQLRVKAGELLIEFEDSGFDMDFNDVVFRLETQNCPNIVVEMVELNAGWDHQVGLEVIRDGIIYSDEIVFESTQFTFLHDRIQEIELEKTTFACEEVTPRTFSSHYIEVFTEPNFGGESEIFEVGADPDLRNSLLGNDSIQSVKLVGGVMVEFFSDAFFGGVIERLFLDDADLSDNVIGSDTVSSINVVPLVIDPNAPAVKNRVGRPAEGEAATEVIAPPPVPACVAGGEFVTQLDMGFFGAEVQHVQNLLKCLGYFPQSVSATGYFGAITRAAVVDFQAAHGLAQSGVLDAATRSLLNAY